ncbi:MSHA biogenesis protein MshQ [Vibrio parahaemolyticus]|nr:MSHA biogenesis protein MshQ [Vibrio parahaemolyticus]EGQ8704652.1 MSHA biogenesis protein MshQ [Vibrio parahaemolyticus]EGQ9119758.1 MSHA biogenesis protein MshQ [Vibrio parahaemolyticus]EGQ9475713.1 MSHA biogenesis protein MshQ [Vibrio parahaemolyticus]EGR3460745.1 MSHA biogenesis protein MshQ [Vibrio parahaemolyticus]
MRKIITLILAKVLLLSSFASFAAVNNNPQFEFGTIPAEDCQVLNNERGVTCDIKFQNTYDEEPLVFVMSTIDASMSNFSQTKTEYPSDLRVWSKSKTQATVKQLFPPHSAACKRLRYNSSKKKWQCTNNNNQGQAVTFVDALMEDIDYLVIEPGVIKFDGDAMIVAGKVSSNLTYSNIGGSTYRSKDVKFRNYGLNTQFASAPGVLVQLQTKNNYKDNQPLWLSSIALNPTTQGFSLILDRSEVTKNAELKHSEEVGFVAGLGQGFVNGRKFWLGDGSTRNTLGDLDDNVIKPITEGCLQVSDFPVSGFKSAPVLLASKRTRNGNNGGWLRRCSVTKTGVALINEEDMQKDSERGHVVEPFSYFLFDKPPVDDVCQLFPSPAQTWDTNTNGELVMSNNTLISGASLSNGKRYVGFKPGKITMHNNASCDNQSCLGDSGLMVQKQTLESFRSPQDSNLQNVIVSGKHGVGERTFNNNEIIGNLSVEETGTVYFESGTYWVGSININNAGKIIIPDGEKVTIHAKSVSISNNNSFFGELEGSELIVLVHDSQSSHVNFGNNTAFSGLLYSEVDVPLSNNVIVNGAITAKNIRMSNNAEIHATDNHCFTPSDNYEVTLSPVTQYALMCGTEQPSFEIETKNDGYAESTGVTVQVYPDADKFSVEVADSTGTGSYPSFTTSNVSSKLGKLKLQVTVTDQSGIELNDEYTLKVMVDNDPSKTQTSTFKFVPFKFDVDDQTIVAGKNYQIDTRVLACSDGQQTVVKSYTGSPSVQLEIETPADGRSDESLLTYEPKFIGSEQGKTSDTFKLMDSGLYTIKLEDANFTCDPQYSDGCPIAPDEEKGEQESVTLNGLFSVKSRPWKIAACNIVAKNGGKTNPATQATGDGFIASAESFNVTYKAVVHSDSGGNANNVCEYPLTQNYFSDSNTAAPLDAEFSVLYPSGGDIANLDSSKGSSLDFSSEEAKAGKTVEYVWNEVGSLNLKTKATYLGMELDEYDVTVGRFYPKYFKVVDSSWTYPESQSFAYMNQPFDAVEFSVEALNANKAAIKNYAGFTTKAEFNLDDIDRYSGRFDAPSFGAGSWSNESDKSIGEFSISNSGQCIGSACWNKDLGGNYPDGPFNSVIGTAKSEIGLIYTNNADPVEYISNEGSNSRLVKQPDIRFGRVDLDDIGGNQGSTLHVPLRVEYWNGSRFIANPNDNQTEVTGVKAAQQHIWPTDQSAKDVTLGEGGIVTSGSSRSVTATQAEPYRQQTRVWLDLDDSANGLPWLKYNWDNKNAGEENPSSVVTFGIHRGNDRVIYRGEPGLTGQ